MPLKNNYLLALLGGLLLSVAWPYTGSFTPVIFIAFAPILLMVKNFEEGARSFFLPLFLAFWIWNLGTTHWLFFVEEAMGTKVFSILGPSIANALVMTLPILGFKFCRKYLGPKRGWFALLFFWLGYEWFHQNWELTWPWLLLGNVFAEQISWVQWYEFTGVQGGTLWVLLSNILFFEWLISIREKMSVAAFKQGSFVRFLLIVLLPIGISFMLRPAETGTGKTKVLAIQPNLNPYTDKYYGAAFAAQLDDFTGSMKAHPDAQLYLLPETALQETPQYIKTETGIVKVGLWEEQIEQSVSFKGLQKALPEGAAVLAGMSSQKMVKLPYHKPKEIRKVYGSEEYGRIAYNAALFLRKQDFGIYHKSKLVPGVEITPYSEIFSLFQKTSIDLGGITGTLGTQEEPDVFWVNDSLCIAPVICYESVFGDYVSGYVRKGANLITIITNDGWWQRSAGHKQHFAYAKLRAVEFRRDVIRCANTGISCHINQRGEVVAELGYEKKGNFVAYPSLNNEETTYARMGDYMGKNALFLAVLILAMAFVRKVKLKSPL